MDSKKFSLYGNTITPDQDRKALAWQQMFVDKFDYDPDEQYELSVHDNAELGEELSSPDALKDQANYRRLTREHSRVRKQLAIGERWLELETQIADNEELLKAEQDPDMQEMIREELAELEPMSAIGPVTINEVRSVLTERLTTLEKEHPPHRYGRRDGGCHRWFALQLAQYAV